MNEHAIHAVQCHVEWKNPHLRLGAASASLYGGGARGVVAPPLNLVCVQSMYVACYQHLENNNYWRTEEWSIP